jgi:hypothetical protein
MAFIDYERLEAIDPVAYRQQRPYPWLNPQGLLRPEAFDLLLKNLPDLAGFERHFDEPRRGGQAPHDRYALEYHLDTPVPEPWHEFIAELRGKRYRRALGRLMGVRRLEFRFHWHYTPNGCSVSPHCDAKRKLGSQIFYLNTDEDWDPSWGGETLVLDDGGRFDLASVRDFDEFDQIASEAIGNRSLIFSRSGNSWHGVREIHCPEDRMRKVFIVVFNQSTLRYRIRDAIKGKEITRY